MVLKNSIKPGLILVVNDRGNKVMHQDRIYTLSIFKVTSIGLIGREINLNTGEVIKCLSKVEKKSTYSVVYLEYKNEQYAAFWSALRIQTDIATPEKIEQYEITHSVRKYNL